MRIVLPRYSCSDLGDIRGCVLRTPYRHLNQLINSARLADDSTTPELHGSVPTATRHSGHWGGSIAGSGGLHNGHDSVATSGASYPSELFPQGRTSTASAQRSPAWPPVLCSTPCAAGKILEHRAGHRPPPAQR